MKKNKSIVVFKENIFKRILKFFKGKLFNKEKNEKRKNENEYLKNKNQKESFFSYLQESTNADRIIEKVMKDPPALYSMSIEELDKLNAAIKIKQEFLDMRVMELRSQI